MILKDFLALYGALHICYRITIKLIDLYFEFKLKKTFDEHFGSNYKTKVFLENEIIGKIKQENAKELNCNDLIEINSKQYTVKDFIKNKHNGCVMCMKVVECNE